MTRIPSLVVGDFNLSAALVGKLAKRVGGELVVGHGVDHAIALDMRVERVLRNLPRAGSDHGPILVDLTIDGERVRVLWWNVYVGQEPAAVLRAVCELADRWQPHVIALGEAYRCRSVLGRVPAYRRHQGRRGEAVAMAVLVRHDVKILRRGWLDMLRAWIGPKHGHHHGPRSFPRLRLELPAGAVFRLLPVHFPTGGYDGPNAAAVLEAAAAVVDWGDQ